MIVVSQQTSDKAEKGAQRRCAGVSVFQKHPKQNRSKYFLSEQDSEQE